MKGRALILHACLVLAAVALDQWIKYLVDTGLPQHTRIDLIPWLALYRTHNTGIAFSMLADIGPVGMIAIVLAVTAFVTVLALRTPPRQRVARIGFALIIGGAIGNLVDRVIHGYVIDYIFFHTPVWSFAVFNLADAFITIGAGLVILDEFFLWRGERAARRRKG